MSAVNDLSSNHLTKKGDFFFQFGIGEPPKKIHAGFFYGRCLNQIFYGFVFDFESTGGIKCQTEKF